MSVVDYEVKFLRLNRYALGMVVGEQDKCVQFEFRLRSDLMMQVTSLQQMVFEALVEKTKICKEVRCMKRERKEQVRALAKRDSSPSGQAPRPVKRAKGDRLR